MERGRSLPWHISSFPMFLALPEFTISFSLTYLREEDGVLGMEGERGAG